MGDGLKIIVQNEKKVAANVRWYKFHKLGKVKKVMDKKAARMVRLAKKGAPVDDGPLQNSIHMRPFRGNDLDIEVGTNMFYAVYQEYGTGKYAVKGNGRKTPWAYVNKKGELVFTHGNRPHPFLHPAFNKVAPSVIPDLKKALKG